MFETDEAVDVTEVKIVGTVITDTTSDANSLDSPASVEEEAITSLDQLSDILDQEEGENGSAVIYDHVNTNTYELNDGAITDSSSTKSQIEQISADSLNENKNTDIFADGENGTVFNTDSNGAAEHDDDDDDEYYAVENHLAQKVLQASSGSPVMSRRNQEEDDDVTGDAVEQNQDEIEEPNPDYDFKQVRFSTEVLDATENKIEPLKEAKSETEPVVDVIDAVEQNPNIQQSDSETNLDTKDGNEENGNLMLKEEINSPVDFLPESTRDEFYFGAEEETTYF